MKTVILAILLLLAVASMVSGEPLPLQTTGKSRCGHETCLFVIIQTLKRYLHRCFCLIAKFVMTKYGGMQENPQAFLTMSLDAEVKTAYPF